MACDMWRNKSFNSLFEMPPLKHSLSPVYHPGFNSLFEMPQAQSTRLGQPHAERFNSLFEMLNILLDVYGTMEVFRFQFSV